MVILDGKNSSKAPSIRVTKKAIPQVDDRYYKLLEDQNAKLQQKIETLESETRTLRDQKEQGDDQQTELAQVETPPSRPIGWPVAAPGQ